ncbi:hypothetical protein PFICI_12856 [Pestalotiopsis fici W106-1]|uniref:Uncharacterized protein n=1 Tax=Pestalotiopsis fici (strain W106-1 / CGMCC3.15140) TaxID=1229662 RepID=W3WRY6_PESFW|nr:uncharacterized protein PFICI_12856 [Pestalotiopsis fici W106-1]ETS75912.1 hypothetical protein PFICI_12856 [Pestalotiopsis fici W106-1]
MEVRLQEIKELAVRVLQPGYPLHLPAQGHELLPTHLQWILSVDHEPKTGCYALLLLNKRAVLEIPDDNDRQHYAPRIAFFHSERSRQKCQCVDFNYLGVPYSEIVHMDKVANKSARILANRWAESGFDIWIHYQNLWAGVASMALSPTGRPKWHKQVIPTFNYDWPRSFCELIFLDLWQHGVAFDSSVPRLHAVANNEALGLYKEEMRRICTEATVRDARRRGNDYALFFAKEVCAQSELLLMRRKYAFMDFGPKHAEFVPSSERCLMRRQSTGALRGLAAQLSAA